MDGRGTPWGRLTDVPGLAVGHAGRVGDGWLSGVTVVVPPPGTVGAVDVRGGGPASHETDALAPSTLVPWVDAICLTGGSAYGLAAASGVQRWCEEAGRGFPVGPDHDRHRLVVPVVPAAAIFDLGRGGDPAARPDAELGHRAATAALGPDTGAPTGAVGAGTGALTSLQAMAGGVGQASVRVTLASGAVATVGALAVVNAMGTPVDPEDGALLGRAFMPPGRERPRPPRPAEALALRAHLASTSTAAVPRANTTLAVVATDAATDAAATWRTAAAAHDGLARALYPAHTLLDGDTVFALATGVLPVTLTDTAALHAAAADAVLLAVLDAVLAAGRRVSPVIDVPGYLDLCPGAVARPD